MKRKSYQMKKKSRTAYRRYRLHKVKKHWVVKSSVIGAMILGGSSSAAAIESVDPAAIEQAVDPKEVSPPLEPEIVEPLQENSNVDNPEAAAIEEQVTVDSTETVPTESPEISKVPEAITTEVEEVEQPDEASTDVVGTRMTPLEEKVDEEIVKPALNAAQTVQNEPEIAALITNLLQAQQNDTVDHYGGVTSAANELKAAVPAAIQKRNEAVSQANAALLYDGYFEIRPGWSYHNVLDAPYAALMAGRSGATSSNPTVTTSELIKLSEDYMVIVRQVIDEITTLRKPGPLSDQGGTGVKTTVTYRYIDRSGKLVIPDVVKDAVSGDEINPEKIAIEGYTYDGEDTDSSDSDMKVNEDGSSLVVYFYRANAGEITYRYVDENGTPIDSDYVEQSTVDAEIPERIIDIENYTYSKKGQIQIAI